MYDLRFYAGGGLLLAMAMDRKSPRNCRQISNCRQNVFKPQLQEVVVGNGTAKLFGSPNRRLSEAQID